MKSIDPILTTRRALLFAGALSLVACHGGSSHAAPAAPALSSPAPVASKPAPDPAVAAVDAPHDEPSEAVGAKPPTPAERLRLARKLERQAAQQRRLAAAEYRREAMHYRRVAMTEQRKRTRDMRLAHKMQVLASRSARRGA